MHAAERNRAIVERAERPGDEVGAVLAEAGLAGLGIARLIERLVEPRRA